MISEQAIKEMQVILKEDYGEELSRPDASDFAYTMVGFFALLAEIEAQTKEESV